MHFYNFSTAKQQSNCDHTIVTKKESSTGKNWLEVSAGTIVAMSIGCIALVVIIPIAVFILVSVPLHVLCDKCCGRLSMRRGHQQFFQTNVAFSFTMTVFYFETVSRDKLKPVDLPSIGYSMPMALSTELVAI